MIEKKENEMKIGDFVDVFDSGAEFEGQVVAINDENDTIAVRDARGVLFNYLPKEGPKGSNSIRYYAPKAKGYKPPVAVDKAPIPDIGTAD